MLQNHVLLKRAWIISFEITTHPSYDAQHRQCIVFISLYEQTNKNVHVLFMLFFNVFSNIKLAHNFFVLDDIMLYEQTNKNVHMLGNRSAVGT